MAFTRFGLEGFGVRRAGSFAGKTATEASVQTPENSVILVPDFAPGPIPRLGELMDSQVDRDFQVLAKLATLNPHLTEVQEWLAEVEGTGDEPIDVFDFGDLEPDVYLFGRSKWRQNR